MCTDLAAEAGIDPGNAARLLRRWTAAGLVQRRQQDGLPRYYAVADPSLAQLATLMQHDSRLVRTLRDALERVAGVDVAVVFGSVARGKPAPTATWTCSRWAECRSSRRMPHSSRLAAHWADR